MTVRLIINADDFGYFEGVSAGILEAVAAGAVTATAVMANEPAFERWAPELRRCAETDVGVHLNATHGAAISRQFAGELRATSGALPTKVRLAAGLLTGRFSMTAVESEWRAQIQRCVAAGLPIRFLNSHEHVHMLPQLFPAIGKLAREFAIPFVRYAKPTADLFFGLAPLLRGLSLRLACVLNGATAGAPEFLGLAASGRLDMQYVRRILPRLRDDTVYELMCHPGHVDATALAERRLRRYHDWAGELACLTSAEFRETLARNRVQPVRFRDLPT